MLRLKQEAALRAVGRPGGHPSWSFSKIIFSLWPIAADLEGVGGEPRRVKEPLADSLLLLHQHMKVDGGDYQRYKNASCTLYDSADKGGRDRSVRTPCTASGGVVLISSCADPGSQV